VWEGWKPCLGIVEGAGPRNALPSSCEDTQQLHAWSIVGQDQWLIISTHLVHNIDEKNIISKECKEYTEEKFKIINIYKDIKNVIENF
jgi:hypothetical protein